MFIDTCSELGLHFDKFLSELDQLSDDAELGHLAEQDLVRLDGDLGHLITVASRLLLPGRDFDANNALLEVLAGQWNFLNAAAKDVKPFSKNFLSANSEKSNPL